MGHSLRQGYNATVLAYGQTGRLVGWHLNNQYGRTAIITIILMDKIWLLEPVDTGYNPAFCTQIYHPTDYRGFIDCKQPSRPGSGKTHTMGTGQSVGEGSAEEGIVPKAPGVSIPLMPFCLGILWHQVIRNSFRHIEANQESIDFKVGSLVCIRACRSYC